MKNNFSKLFFILLCFIVATTCKKLDKSMLVSTGDVTSIESNMADAPGIVIDLGGGATQHGHFYGTAPNLKLTDLKSQLGTPSIGGFTSQLTNLAPGTRYYVKAYMTDGVETVFGEEKSFTTLSPSVPTMSTTAITSITLTTATGGGTITVDGGATVTSRGVCWSTTSNPTISDTKTSDGTGTGIFSSNLTGLTIATTYHVRAYATNSAGTAYGSDVTFATQAIVIPTVTTTAVTAITTATATSGGYVTADGGAAVISRGVCWSTALNPAISDSRTTDGSGTGSFVSTLTNLTPLTTYHVRAYATNSAGTAWGSDVTFATQAIVIPTVTTTAVTAITAVSATSGGNVTADGGATVTSRGVCWSTTSNPAISDSKTADVSENGSFVSALTNLIPLTIYHVRAYATNSAGTAYGSEVIFTTLAVIVPTVTTTDVSAIAATYATGGGNVTSDGGATITSRGVCWSTSQDPTVGDNKTVEGSGNGQFSCSITSLEPATTYYVRSFATNIAGTAYGAQTSFVTLKVLPVITTKDVTNISAFGGTSGGIITSTGGGTISAKGICWGESPNPTINDYVINSGTGTSSFNSSIVSAVPNTIYYVRSYATNEIGSSYGDQKSFTTLDALFYGFESGVMPVGFSGQWSLVNSGNNSNYSIRSLYALSCSFTMSSTYTNAGVIRFSYKFSDYGCGTVSIFPTIKFYIDDVEQNTFAGDGAQSWVDAVVSVPSGTHVFKWLFIQGHYIGNPYCGNGADMGTGFVDNIYIIQ